MSKHEPKEDSQDIVFEAGAGEEEAGDASVLVARVKKLRAELKACQRERQEYLDGWQRAKADYLNLKKENEAARLEVVRYAKEDLLHSLIRVTDSFELAFANRAAWEQAPENWRKGVEYIYAQLEEVFDENGLVAVDPRGAAFDPAEHHSIGVVAVDDKQDDGKVLQVIKRGYKLNGRIIRPAQVKVGELKK